MMDRNEIVKQLGTKYKSFTDFVVTLSDEEFTFSPEGKWTAGQQLDHLIRAVSPLSSGLRLPVFAMKMIFGKANRPSKTYDELVKKYKAKLAEGGKARGQFIPVLVAIGKRQKSCQILLKKVDQLGRCINSFSENQLDLLILPHPLLGRVTLREMMFFTIYHAEHHLKQTIENSGKASS